MKNRAVRSVLLGFLFFSGLVSFPALRGSGQVRKVDAGVVNVFLPAPREAKQRLTQARAALDEQRFADAVDNLDKLLRDPENEDYFIGSGPDEGTQTSIKAEALRVAHQYRLGPLYTPSSLPNAADGSMGTLTAPSAVGGLYP